MVSILNEVIKSVSLIQVTDELFSVFACFTTNVSIFSLICFCFCSYKET